jgi:hypothetical protein
MVMKVKKNKFVFANGVCMESHLVVVVVVVVVVVWFLDIVWIFHSLVDRVQKTVRQFD